MKLVTKVYKMGNKLGISLNKKQLRKLNLKKGDYISVKLYKLEASTEFITRVNYNIVLRKSFAGILRLEPNDEITIVIEPIFNSKRTEEIFRNNKIDLLSLIPEKTFLGYEIFVTPFRRNNRQWLRIWYAHERGSSRQIELIRFIDVSALGRVLGQLQAEGDKFSERRKHRIVFTNKLLKEHEDFINDIRSFGISTNDIQFFCTFNIDRFDKAETEREIKNLCESFGISDIQIKPTRNIRIWRSFRTIIRRSILAEILLYSMDFMRKFIIEQPLNSQLELFAQNFLSKLLTGDGTIDIRKREYGNPTVRICIIDGNLEFLEDYRKILQKFGFKPRIRKEEIKVRAHCSFEHLLFLYKIKAFYNSNNWNKLVITISLKLNGRRIKTFERFAELLNYDSFSANDMSKLFGLTNSASKDWLSNVTNNGFTKVIDGNYVLSEKAKEIGELIPKVRKSLDEIHRYGNLWDTLEYLKVKKAIQPKRALIP
jgi:hypothetical protein